MRRRDFISLLGGAVTAWPIAARAQQAAMPVIGFLGFRSAAVDVDLLEAFRRGLAENGFVAGQNVQIEFRWAEGQTDRLPAMAAELVRRRVTLIVAAGGGAGPAAKRATATIPIVFSTGGDPVRLGLVASFNRPGGNLTGATTLLRELEAKRFGLLRDLLPNVTRVGYLIGREEPDAEYIISTVQEAARATGREVVILNVRTERDIEAAFEGGQRESGALLVGPGGSLTIRRGLIIALAARHGLPVLYNLREFVTLGGLMSYGTSFAAMYQQVGVYAGRVLKGGQSGRSTSAPANQI